MTRRPGGGSPESGIRRVIQPVIPACVQPAPRLAPVRGRNSSVRLQPLDDTIQEFLDGTDS